MNTDKQKLMEKKLEKLQEQIKGIDNDLETFSFIISDLVALIEKTNDEELITEMKKIAY